MTCRSPHPAARSARILAWAADDPPLQRRFRRQLASATGWDTARCERAITEYLRFCAVAAQLGGRAVPSEDVDKVCHLHLTWTRDYWEDFCPNRMGFPFHHQPARGLPGEREVLRLGYAETLHTYQALLGTPDPAWWPAWSAFRPRGRRGRVGLAAASGLLASLTAQAFPGPLDWRGPDFLALYFPTLGGCLLFALLWRLWHRLKRSPTRGIPPGETPLWQLAFLRGGPRGVVDAATARLYEDGFLEWDATRKQLVRRGDGMPQDALLRALLPNLTGSPARLVLAERAGVMQELRDRLIRQGWWHSEDEARRIARISALPLWLLAGFGTTKIAIGLYRDAPVTLLVLGVIVTLMAALVLHFSRPQATRAGRERLAAEKARHALALRAPRKGQLALAVALAGTGVLAGTAIAGYHGLRHPSNAGDASTSDGADGCGGAGCGGCGGD
ncbi:MAG: hypothetical protein KatS3mg126_1517 [Lysobacteraceae bacterium]|nr:MAG: hypothetical protein KatS3mg126_1517 [Xanthomonadaceae bacterium]